MALNFFEPEEAVGALWHRLAGAPPGPPHFPQAGVALAPMRNRLAVYFHGLGGDGAVGLKSANAAPAHYRLSARERLGHAGARFNGLRVDGQSVFLPGIMDALPERALNEALYFWLTAFAACTPVQTGALPDDPLQADIARLRNYHQTSQHVLASFPGLAERYEALRKALLAVRPARTLPPPEDAVEQTIRAMLGGARETGCLLDLVENPAASMAHLQAPKGYRPFMPVMLWGERALDVLEPGGRDNRQAANSHTKQGPGSDKSYAARRRKADHDSKKDALLFNRFEAILSLAEMLNLRRTIDDDSLENARKAADDLDELSLADVAERPVHAITFDLDLAPQDVEHERLSGRFLYPEWDYRSGQYLPDHCQVLHSTATAAPETRYWRPDAAAKRRIAQVRRRFEALRPRRELLRRQLDGTELDMDGLVSARCDLAANGHGSDAVYMQARHSARDLGVAVLFDASRSTESWIAGRQVIDVGREALLALSLGLGASGDDHAVYAFSSLKRSKVFVQTLKRFAEKPGAAILRRIGALRPGHYTRLGAALRHVSQLLQERPNAQKLLLVITDGKPNDLDHYEGRYGIEDTRRAIRDARAAGQAVFGITVDSKARDYFPYLFGRNGFSILSSPDRLTNALPLIFQHLLA